MLLAEVINEALKPIRDRRAELAANPEYITEVLADGAERARAIARKTMAEVRKNINLV
jgi:tryptophanyl-tRNA synthetase